jgi:hypothetical protein
VKIIGHNRPQGKHKFWSADWQTQTARRHEALNLAGPFANSENLCSTPFSSTLPRAAMIDLLSAMSSSALGGLR